MKLSGFSMCRNAEKLYYPVRESILSVLPIVDEFVIAIGKSDPDDGTLGLIRSINSEKIRIIETEWDLVLFPHGMVHARQTDLAKAHCQGDWLIYLQADEVIHERDHENILRYCDHYLGDVSVEGFVLRYLHFWGDYSHLQTSHSWYDQEIRIIRNDPQIHSWESAQSFRHIPDFDGLSYRDKHGTRKLNVRSIPVAVYHYGWVRPPEVMTRKMNELDRIHSHPVERYRGSIDYGDLARLPTFQGSHPSVMREHMAKFNWSDHMRNPGFRTVKSMRKDSLRSKILTWIENRLLNGRKIFTYKNYRLLG